jgi:N-acetyl-alpha-D-glucosaminyl L-malate synthase BshA
MNIGIVCYASIGGSGIVATELGKALASRGHRVHVMSADLPVRLGDYQPGLWFHRVETPSYPLFREPQYVLSLASKIVAVSRDEHLDVVHAHYAIPHATAACLARQVLASKYPAHVPRVITTLHGTDITLLGNDPSYSEIVTFGIEQSDGVTAVSRSLAADTRRELGVTCDIRVIPNFVDTNVYRRRGGDDVRRRLSPDGRPIVMHVSNFRPVKRLQTVVDVFARVRQATAARLVLVGDGPEAPGAARRVRERGLQNDVEFVGEQDFLVPLLSAADVFLLPSSQESFGLAALEAMACGVPVVASRIGGIPEVVQDETTGFLHDPDDLEQTAGSVIRLVSDRALWSAMSAASRTRAETQYRDAEIVPLYEGYYRELLGRPAVQP